jgi:hypothetical protein
MNYWIAPASSKPMNDPTYGSIDYRKPLTQIVYHGRRAWDRALPAGEYRIEFDSKNGQWIELLSIYVQGNYPKQKIHVMRPSDGRMLYTGEY